MNKFGKMYLIIAALLSVGILADYRVSAEETIQTDKKVRVDRPIRPEVRAFWVDAFRDGIKTPAQVDRLVQDALTANVNTLIVQVRRRGDAYYNKSFEPRTEDPVLTPGFDSLQYLIEKAHAHQIEVHAWLNTLVAWHTSKPPKDPKHIWNTHGPRVSGRDNWVSYYRKYNKDSQSWSKETFSSFFLDPGHPDVVDYTTEVYLNVVRNYDVDGIHLDYSRYAGMNWGYNPTSIDRYNARYGTTGLPEPDDPQWAEWRREQTANLVRKIYLKAIAIKPTLKVSSAVITWGDGPVAEDDWEKSKAYREVFQDWRSWLKEGILDIAIPMNYFSEWDSTQQLWYNHWIEWEKNNQHGRQIVIGPGNFMQYIEDTLEQVRRAQEPSSQGNYAAGICLFAYGASHLFSSDDFASSASSMGFPRQPHRYLPKTNSWLFPLLSKEGTYVDPVLKKTISTKPVFPAPAPIPDMPWKSQPSKGYLMGTIADGTNKRFDYTKVIIDGWVTVNKDTSNPTDARLHYEVYTDGSGWFGIAELPAGLYRISIDTKEIEGAKTRLITVKPGRVFEVRFGI